MSRRSPQAKRERAAEDDRIEAFVDRKYRLVLSAVVEAAKRYEAAAIDWVEFDAVIHGYTIVAKDLWLAFQRPRAELLRLVEGEERGEYEWDPVHDLALEQRHRRVPRKLRDRSAGTLEGAVATLTDEATKRRRASLVRSVESWRDLAVHHMKTNDFTGFLDAAIGADRGDLTFQELERWLALLQDIWNNTPMPDRGGRTPYEILREGRGRR